MHLNLISGTREMVNRVQRARDKESQSEWGREKWGGDTLCYRNPNQPGKAKPAGPSTIASSWLYMYVTHSCRCNSCNYPCTSYLHALCPKQLYLILILLSYPLGKLLQRSALVMFYLLLYEIKLHAISSSEIIISLLLLFDIYIKRYMNYKGWCIVWY